MRLISVPKKELFCTSFKQKVPITLVVTFQGGTKEMQVVIERLAFDDKMIFFSGRNFYRYCDYSLNVGEITICE